MFLFGSISALFFYKKKDRTQLSNALFITMFATYYIDGLLTFYKIPVTIIMIAYMIACCREKRIILFIDYLENIKNEFSIRKNKNINNNVKIIENKENIDSFENRPHQVVEIPVEKSLESNIIIVNK